MTPERIDTFIDRLCAYFPTQIIARNTVKSAWRRDDTFIDATDEDAIKVLKKCESLDKFPNLSAVKQFFRTAKGEVKGKFECVACDSTGFDIGRVWHEDGTETFYSQYDPVLEREYSYVLRCKVCHS